MILKVEESYQLVGFIEDAETKRISLVTHAANELPFAVVKSEEGIDWVESQEEKEDKYTTELKALATMAKIAPTQIKFPSNMSKEEVSTYMNKFENNSFEIAKVQDYFIAKSKVFVDTEGSKLVVLPSGIAYTLNKFNVSDTIKSEKETSEMSKKQTKKSDAVTVAVDSKDSLIAALKGLSHEDMLKILNEVLPEDSKIQESKEEAEAGDKEGTEELIKESTSAEDEKPESELAEKSEKESEVVEVESEKSVEKSEDLSEDFINALSEEFEAQAEITKQLADDVATMAEKVEELVNQFNEASAKVEKSLNTEEAIEILVEVQKSLASLEERVESLELTPADSEIVEKSEEVAVKQGVGFLKKYL